MGKAEEGRLEPPIMCAQGGGSKQCLSDYYRGGVGAVTARYELFEGCLLHPTKTNGLVDKGSEERCTHALG